jgi:hypothetical protein
VKSSPFLAGLVPDSGTKWRSPVTQSLIMKDLAENFNETEQPKNLNLTKNYRNCFQKVSVDTKN